MNEMGRQTTIDTPLRPQTWRWFAVAIILLGGALRLYQLGQDSLWLDEIITQQMTQRSVEKMLTLVGTYSAHPPLYYLLAYQNRLLGFSDYAARLTSVAAGILTIPVLIILAREIWGSGTGLIAGMLLALWPTHLHFSQEARQYALLMLFTSISMYWLYRGVSGDGSGAWIGYIISTAGALYSHNFAFLWVAAQVIFVGLMWLSSFWHSGVSGLKSDARHVILPFTISFISICILYWPWAPSLLTQSNRLIDGVSLTAAAGVDGPSYATIIQQSLRFFSGKNVVFGTIIILLALTGLIVAAIQRRWTALLLILSSLIVPILTVGLISSSHFFTARYLFPLLTPIILLSAEALRPLFRINDLAFKQSERATLLGQIAIVLAIAALAIFPIQKFYQREKEDWHGVARLLTDQKATDDFILADGMLLDKAGDAGRVQQALGYYLPDETIIEASPASVQAVLDYHDPNATVWGVIWYQHQLGSRDQVSADIEIIDYYDLAIIRMEEPTGDLLKDTTEILEAMLTLQRQAESHPDLHLLLAEIYLEQGLAQQAADHATAAIHAIPTSDSRLLTALFHALESPQIPENSDTIDFIDQLEIATLSTPESDFPLFEQTAFTIDGSARNVLMLHPPAILSYSFHIPADATYLTTSLAVDPETWNWGGDGVTFQLDVVTSEVAKRVFERQIGIEEIDQHWHDVLIDMRPYSDIDGTITFSVDPGPTGDFTGDRAGWAKPILWLKAVEE